MENEAKEPLLGGAKEPLLKVINPEGEFEIPVGDNERRKVYWVRTGFADRILFRSYFKKKLQEATDSGILGIKGRFQGEPSGATDGKNTIFGIDPTSIAEDTLVVYKKGILLKKMAYTYSPEIRMLFFIDPPTERITVEYDYYEQDIYEQLFNDSFMICLIFLSARDLKDHKKRIFKTIDDVGKLSVIDVNQILSLYNKNVALSETELKNSPAPSVSPDEGATQKGGN